MTVPEFREFCAKGGVDLSDISDADLETAIFAFVERASAAGLPPEHAFAALASAFRGKVAAA